MALRFAASQNRCNNGAIGAASAAAAVVGGNTANLGIEKYYNGSGYPPAPPALAVDVQNVAKMRVICHQQLSDSAPATSTGDLLVFGAAITLEELWTVLLGSSTSRMHRTMAEYLLLVANPQVRSVGTVGGNLAMAARYPDFPLDVALMLAAAGVTASVVEVSTGSRSEVEVETLLKSSNIEGLGSSHLLVSFKLPLGEEKGTFSKSL